jgi:hypothetical protein
MGEYKVAKNETLSSIADKYNFKHWQPIYDATNEKWPGRITNPNIISEGMTIFIPEKKPKKVEQSDGTSVKYKSPIKQKQILRLCIKDSHNEIRNVKEDIVLKINGGVVEINDETIYGKNHEIPVKYKTIATKKPLPDGLINNSSLEINLTLRNGKKVKETIALEVGGLDPFIDPNTARDGKPADNIQANKAVQKVLKNQGYYFGEIDGDLTSQESVLALISFQLKNKLFSEHFGKPTDITLTTLKKHQGQAIDQERFKNHELSGKVAKKLPLFVDDDDKERYHFMTLGKGWKQKPSAGPADNRSEVFARVGKIDKFFKRDADWHEKDTSKISEDLGDKSLLNLNDNCVAPSHQYSKNEVNYCRGDGSEFIFLDVGRWKNAARDFGVVYGRNVYLCSYNWGGKGIANNHKMDGFPFIERQFGDKKQYRDGLDLELFRGFYKSFTDTNENNTNKAKGIINIQACGYVDWVREKNWDDKKENDHFDWDHIHIILPDMHLMSPEVAEVWYRVLDKDGKDHIFLKAERDLFDFVTDLTERIGFDTSKVKVINVGDVYDLWVGMGVRRRRKKDGKLSEDFNLPLFEENQEEKMIIIDEPGHFYVKNNDYVNEYLASKENKYKFILEGIKKIQKIMGDHLNPKKLPEDNGRADYEAYHEKIIKYNHEIHALKTWFRNNGADVNDYKNKYNYESGWHYLNPAVAALRKLEGEKFKGQISYIYGNHDSYLADKDLAGKAGLKTRAAFYPDKPKSLHIEHGQRLEAFFLNNNKKYKVYDLDNITAERQSKTDLENLGISVVGHLKDNSAEILKDGGKYVYKKTPLYLKGGVVLGTTALVVTIPPITIVAGTGAIIIAGTILAVSYFNGVTEIDFPTNEDGNFSGCIATCNIYNTEKEYGESLDSNIERDVKYVAADQADTYAGSHDQRIYRREFARYWVGKKSKGEIPPSIFVIGHTHMPQLIHVKIISEDLDEQIRKKDNDEWEKQREETEKNNQLSPISGEMGDSENT